MAIELARAGKRVVGLDFSPAMIARAQEKAAAEEERVRRRVSFVVADMADFRLGRRFRTAIIPCFSFHELATFEAQQACVRTISRHLTMGGLLVIALGIWSEPTNTAPPPEPADFGKPKEEGYNPHTGLFTRMW